jgi:DNA-binding TFAR19-related protein (PDSD5 family)
MSDRELAAIREKKLKEFQKRLIAKQSQPETSSSDILNKIFKDRAWEVFTTASNQFPDAMNKVKNILIKLTSTGKLTEVTGEELFVFLKKLGLDVKLKTKITYASHGQLKSIEEKMKEEFNKT